MTDQEIQRRFTYHKPDAERADRHEMMRDAFKGVARFVSDMTPEGREQSLAMTHLEQALMWANAAIARD
jgi:hypothetical protein